MIKHLDISQAEVVQTPETRGAQQLCSPFRHAAGRPEKPAATNCKFGMLSFRVITPGYVAHQFDKIDIDYVSGFWKWIPIRLGTTLDYHTQGSLPGSGRFITSTGKGIQLDAD
jgi:hypothetical protein